MRLNAVNGHMGFLGLAKVLERSHIGVFSRGGGVNSVSVQRSFTLKEAAYLRSLPAVKEVSAFRVTYDHRFKVECVRRYLKGESARMIFRDAGLDASLIGSKRIERCIARWKKDPVILRELNQADSSGDLKGFCGKNKDFESYFDCGPQLQNQDIADAAFAAISGNKHAQSTIDMQELIIYQQSQHIAMLQQQLTQLRQKLESMEQTEKAVERAAMPKERSASV